ncbi:hypothetical protein KR044_012747 [Drosophila immigrans]|nr:hypothetical protein KR044_012747 [Drosophila immigrans]
MPFVLWLVCCSIITSESSEMGKDAWLRPGCHKVGNTRKISIPNCVEFVITTNACRGFCESYAVPSMPSAITAISSLFRPPKPVVSVGQCCNMMKSEEVTFRPQGVDDLFMVLVCLSLQIQRRVLCIDGFRNVTFRSATTCSCYHCKKD